MAWKKLEQGQRLIVNDQVFSPEREGCRIEYNFELMTVIYTEDMEFPNDQVVFCGYGFMVLPAKNLEPKKIIAPNM